MKGLKWAQIKLAVFLLVLLSAGVVFSLFGGLPQDETAKIILEQIRIPRTLAALMAGAVLSSSGAILQRTFFNPLVEPYTLGVASGAALGGALLSGFAFGVFWGSVAGAAVVFLVLFVLLSGEKRTSEQALLVGIMINVFCSSALAVWMALANQEQVRGIYFWLLGDLSRVSLLESTLLVFPAVLLYAWAARNTFKMDAFLFGPNQVASFGVSISQIQLLAVGMTLFSISLVVSICGVIGFVGLIAPHLAKKFVGPRMSHLLWVSALIGMNLLLYSDWIARTVASPLEVPVGAVTALMGAPVLVWVLKKYSKEVRAS